MARPARVNVTHVGTEPTSGSAASERTATSSGGHLSPQVECNDANGVVEASWAVACSEDVVANEGVAASIRSPVLAFFSRRSVCVGVQAEQAVLQRLVAAQRVHRSAVHDAAVVHDGDVIAQRTNKVNYPAASGGAFKT